MSFFSSLGKALKSKTVWAGIGTAALGIGQIAQQYAPTILSFVPAASPVGAGIIIGTGVLTIIGRIKAKQPLGPVIDDTIAQTVAAVHEIQGNGSPSIAKIEAVTTIVKNQPPPLNPARGA